MTDRHIYVFGWLKEIAMVNGENIFAGDVRIFFGQAPGVKGGQVVAFGLGIDQTGSEELIEVADMTL